MVLHGITLKKFGVTSIFTYMPQNSWIMRIPYPDPLYRRVSHDKHFIGSLFGLGLVFYLRVCLSVLKLFWDYKL